MGVAPQVAQHALGSREGELGVDDPVALAKPVQESGQRVVGSEVSLLEALSQPVEGLASEDLRKGADGEEEARVSHGDPARAVGGERPARDHAVREVSNPRQ